MNKLETILNNSITKTDQKFNNINIILGNYNKTYFDSKFPEEKIQLLCNYYSKNYKYCHNNIIRYTINKHILNLSKNRSKSEKIENIKSLIIGNDSINYMISINKVFNSHFSNSQNFHNEENLEIIQFNIYKNIKLNIELNHDLNIYTVYLSCYYDKTDQSLIENLEKTIENLNNILFNKKHTYSIIKK